MPGDENRRFESRLTRLCALGCLFTVLIACEKPEPVKEEPSASNPSSFEVPRGGYVLDLPKSEEISSAMVKRFKESVLAGFRDLQMAPIENALAQKFSGTWPQADDETTSRSNRLSVSRLRPSGSLESLQKEAFTKRLQALFDTMSGVERAGYHVYQSYAMEGSDTQVVQKAHFNLAGLLRSTNERFEVKADLYVRFSDRSPRAQIVALAVEKWERTVTSLERFVDASASAGFRLIDSTINLKNWQAAIDERTVITVGGLSVVDVNHDGYWDVLVPRYGVYTLLYLNDGIGGFTVRSIEGLSEAENTGKFLLWGDFNQDKKDEVVNTRVFSSVSKNKKRTVGELGFFRIKDLQATRVRGALQFEMPTQMVKPQYEGIVPCDVNNDQQIDLLFLGYKHQNSKPENNYTQAEDGVRNLLFINKGKDGFREEGRARGLVRTQYSFIAKCFDFDGDGDNDLFIGNDYGSNRYLTNDGTGHFVEDNDHPFHKGASFSMGVSLADVHNTGQLMMSVANMYSHAGNRIVTLASDLSQERQQSLLRMAQGNALYVQQADGTWTDQGKQFGVEDAGWAWGNIFFDVDNDRDKDLIVVNGYTSHSDPTAPDY